MAYQEIKIAVKWIQMDGEEAEGYITIEEFALILADAMRRRREETIPIIPDTHKTRDALDGLPEAPTAEPRAYIAVDDLLAFIAERQRRV